MSRTLSPLRPGIAGCPGGGVGPPSLAGGIEDALCRG